MQKKISMTQEIQKTEMWPNAAKYSQMRAE
jgi:hypothetical protein